MKVYFKVKEDKRGKILGSRCKLLVNGKEVIKADQLKKSKWLDLPGEQARIAVKTLIPLLSPVITVHPQDHIGLTTNPFSTAGLIGLLLGLIMSYVLQNKSGWILLAIIIYLLVFIILMFIIPAYRISVLKEK